MKKTIFSGLLALTLIFPLSSFAAPVEQADFDAMKAQLIALITQEIAALQAQLLQMIAAEASTNATVSKIQTQMQVSAGPVTVAGASAPVTPPSPISFSVPTSYGKLSIPLTDICLNGRDGRTFETFDVVQINGLNQGEKENGTFTYRLDVISGGFLNDNINVGGISTEIENDSNVTEQKHVNYVYTGSPLIAEVGLNNYHPVTFKFTILDYKSDSGRVVTGLPIELPQVTAHSCQ